MGLPYQRQPNGVAVTPPGVAANSFESHRRRTRAHNGRDDVLFGQLTVPEQRFDHQRLMFLQETGVERAASNSSQRDFLAEGHFRDTFEEGSFSELPEGWPEMEVVGHAGEVAPEQKLDQIHGDGAGRAGVSDEAGLDLIGPRPAWIGGDASQQGLISRTVAADKCYMILVQMWGLSRAPAR